MQAFLKMAFFFFLGFFVSGAILIAISYLVFSANYKNKIYPGVKVAGHDLSNLSQSDAEKVLTNRFAGSLENLNFYFSNGQASISATGKELNLQPNVQLMAQRAFSIGRQTQNPYYNFAQIFSSWNGQINLPMEVNLDTISINNKIDTIAPLIEKQPIDAIYEFIPQAGPDKKGRVSAFRPSENGRRINRNQISNEIINFAKVFSGNRHYIGTLPVDNVSPTVKSTTADELGIKNLLASGQSYFYDSIPGRIYNISLGTSKVNGSLIAPNEIFSFDQAIGTVSAVFGFQKAYSIVKGKTVLDDGGGVCQVSTTLYRAALNAGLPIIERAHHSYRVGFYEQGGFLPGMDATVYPPSPDLKIKNDTGGWILIQTTFDPDNHRLTFDLFGTSDGRKTTLTGPVIVSTTAPPEPVYEDDPTKPVGVVTQVDTAHYGAKVYFKRQVSRGSEILIDETVWSDYVPWPARFLKGTKT